VEGGGRWCGFLSGGQRWVCEFSGEDAVAIAVSSLVKFRLVCGKRGCEW